MENPLRIGNDANFEWSVKKVVGDEKVPYDLTGRNLQLFLVGRVDRIEVTDFVVNENVISWTFYGKDQQHTGIYNALLVENMGEERMVTVDIQYAVTLVPHSWIITGEDGDGCGCVTMDTIYLESAFTMEPGPRGYSAYEVAVQQGYVGTVDEWLESLVGFSPSASVTKEGDTATITITDREGTTTATVRDGSDADVTRENIEEALGGAPVMVETDPTVPDWAKEANKPSYTPQEVGALPAGTTLADLPDDSGHRTVSDTEKVAWSDNQVTSQKIYNALGYMPLAPSALAGYITKYADDLVYYYTKSETYNREEIQQLISSVAGLTLIPVAVLPTASADTMGGKIYLVPSENPETQNTKDEYITVHEGGVYRWEQIGSTAIDLSPYITDDYLQSVLEDYITGEGLRAALAGYVTAEALNAALANYVSTEAFQQALAGKADKDTDAVEGNFAAFDSSGNPVDSGHKHSDYLTSHQDISGKADKVSNPTSGNFAGLDANGNLTDSGSKASDFATAAQGAKADTAYQKPSGGIPSTDMSEAVQTSLGKADTALQSFMETDPTVPSWAKAQNPPQDVFVVEYNVTTFNEIKAAINAGKTCVLIYGSRGYFLSYIQGEEYIYFSTLLTTTSLWIRISSSNVWSSSSFGLQPSSDKVSTIVGNESNTNKYPSTKAVADYVASRELSDLSDVSDTAPTDGQALLWDGTNEEWKPGTAQGGGSVTDVTVGGTSVVNASGVAEVPAIPETVQAQEIEIDSAPTANSSNLVTSGGVASALAGKYTKPAGGIPSTDLADPESVFIIPINLGTLTVDSSVTYQDIVDAYNAGKVFAFSFGAVLGIIPATQYGASNGEYSIIAEYIMSVSSGGIDGASMILQATSSALTFTMTPQELDVPEISTDINADATSDAKTASPKAVKTFVEGKGYGTYSKPSGGIPSSDLAPDVVPVIPVDTAIPSGGLGANVHYALGTLTGSVSITLDTTTEVTGQMNIYSLVFTAGATAPTITWPSAITKWAGNCLDSTTLAPVITGGNTYEVSIVDGLAVITEFVA